MNQSAVTGRPWLNRPAQWRPQQRQRPRLKLHRSTGSNFLRPQKSNISLSVNDQCQQRHETFIFNFNKSIMEKKRWQHNKSQHPYWRDGDKRMFGAKKPTIGGGGDHVTMKHFRLSFTNGNLRRKNSLSSRKNFSLKFCIIQLQASHWNEMTWTFSMCKLSVYLGKMKRNCGLNTSAT